MIVKVDVDVDVEVDDDVGNETQVSFLVLFNSPNKNLWKISTAGSPWDAWHHA